jgi:fused signal recognition particle receptor
VLRFLQRRDRGKTEQGVKKTRQTWLSRVASVLQRSELDQGLWDELEELLISGDVGLATSERLIASVRDRAREEHVTSPDGAVELLKRIMVELLTFDGSAALFEVEKRPLVLLVAGVNGVGKTTSVAKLAHWFKGDGNSVVLGAADTFRAAAIDQLQTWGRRLDVDVIAHQPGADPAAVAFDTVQAATSRGTDVVIIDTAGRLHTKRNLMEEIKKVQRVLSRQGGSGSQRVILILDATTGQNGLIQAQAFKEALDCDGVFLAKLDGTAKGGIVLAISADLGLPVLYIGTGEQPEDLAPFEPGDFVEGLFAPLGPTP